MELHFESTFELLSQDEWNQYLNVDLFDDMIVAASDFSIAGDVLQSAKFPRLKEIITEHNNKVGLLRVTYALCRHYYDKGIPDDPFWGIAMNGRGIQYMPNFSAEHWGHQFWFNYFASSYYLRMSVVWDSIMEIINFYYDYGIKSDSNFKRKLYKKMKESNPGLKKIFDNVRNNETYKFADNCRDQAAHGTFVGEVHDTIKVQTDIEKDFFLIDENGKLVIENGRPKTKKKLAKLSVSSGVGEYTDSNTIMNNMEGCSRLTGELIQEIIGRMISWHC